MLCSGWRMIGCGIALGLLGAYGLARFMEHHVYVVDHGRVLTLVVTALVLVFSATVAGFLPAWRASRLEPAHILRQE